MLTPKTQYSEGGQTWVPLSEWQTLADQCETLKQEVAHYHALADGYVGAMAEVTRLRNALTNLIRLGRAYNNYEIDKISPALEQAERELGLSK